MIHQSAAQTEQAGLPRVKRRALIAGPLSLLMPGVGQLYNGDLRRAAAFFGTAVVLEAVARFALTIPPWSLVVVAGAFTATLATLLLRVAAAIDAVRTARRCQTVVLTRWSRTLVGLAALAASFLISMLLEALISGASKFRTYNFPSGSMSPTVLPGERFIAWQGYYADRLPERGDLAVFGAPRDAATDYLKRVVGLPGDRIQLMRGILHVNSEAVTLERLPDWSNDLGIPVAHFIETLPGGRAHRIIEYRDDSSEDNTPAFIVPPDHYFVLGDNRDNSLDSRVERARYGVGFVPRENLRDRPTFVYWSADWHRIGTELK